MRRLIGVVLGVGVVGLVVSLAEAGAEKCPGDSVAVGPACVDMYEASVWEIPAAGNSGLIKKVKEGKAKLSDLTSATAIANGVVQHGASSDDYGAGCPDTGNGCVNFYAVSIAGVTPSAFITWFQAAAAARNSGKRLPTNQEWQAAALGTPDTGGADDGATTCNTDNLAPGVTATGSRSACVSDVGAFDMVGNLWEWVADWVPLSTACPGWATVGSFSSDDFMCLAGASITGGPGALLRGGFFTDGSNAGVFAVLGSFTPSLADFLFGFRAAR